MNDYLREFEELRSKSSFRMEQWLGGRQDLVEQYGWAVPNDEAIEYISSFDSICSVGSGKAYWEHLVSQAGTHVECFDLEPPDETYMDVECNDGLRASRQSDRPVLTVWPPYQGGLAVGLVKIEQVDELLYVGEPYGGCTGCTDFWDEIERFYERVNVIEIPSYEGVHDNLYHFRKL